MKYELIKETNDKGHFRIKALKDFGDVKKGDLGGFVESTKNLSQYGNCWVYNGARVFGNAFVSSNAGIYSNAQVYDNADVRGNVDVHGNAIICGNTQVFGDAEIYGNAIISQNAQVYGNAIVSQNVNGNSKILGNPPPTTSKSKVRLVTPPQAFTQVDPLEQFEKDDGAYMESIKNPSLSKDCCDKPDKYENIISRNLRFYSCRSCGADLGDIVN